MVDPLEPIGVEVRAVVGIIVVTTVVPVQTCVVVPVAVVLAGTVLDSEVIMLEPVVGHPPGHDVAVIVLVDKEVVV